MCKHSEQASGHATLLMALSEVGLPLASGRPPFWFGILVSPLLLLGLISPKALYQLMWLIFYGICALVETVNHVTSANDEP